LVSHHISDEADACDSSERSQRYLKIWPAGWVCERAQTQKASNNSHNDAIQHLFSPWCCILLPNLSLFKHILNIITRLKQWASLQNAMMPIVFPCRQAGHAG